MLYYTLEAKRLTLMWHMYRIGFANETFTTQLSHRGRYHSNGTKCMKLLLFILFVFMGLFY